MNEKSILRSIYTFTGGQSRRILTLAPVVLMLVTFVWLLLFNRPDFAHSSSNNAAAKDTAHKESSLPTSETPSDYKPRLHLLIPGTKSNLNFCRLLLSATALEYPVPILIDYGGEGLYDAAASHLAKIYGVIRYLDTLPSQHDDDIVLLVDGYDTFFQLPAELFLQRYFDINDEANKRLADQLGADVMKKHNIKQTTFWGPDRLCWPVDEGRPACWAVPNSTIPWGAFGPGSERDTTGGRPRWLNSGTVMGPVTDIRRLFKATVDMIKLEYDSVPELAESDQRYFADVWAEQEYRRILLMQEKDRKPLLDMAAEKQFKIPEIPADRDVEYHQGIDYESSLFQTNAGYVEFIDWFTFNTTNPAGSTSHSLLSSSSSRERVAQLTAGYAAYAKQRHLPLPRDLVSFRPPFHLLKSTDPTLAATTWNDVDLGVNVITQTVFGIFHCTGFKHYLHIWWPHMWFIPHAEKLLVAASKLPFAPFGDGVGGRLMGGKVWWPAGVDEVPKDKVVDGKRPVKVDTGSWLSWKEVCGEFEQELYHPKQPQEIAAE